MRSSRRSCCSLAAEIPLVDLLRFQPRRRGAGCALAPKHRAHPRRLRGGARLLHHHGTARRPDPWPAPSAMVPCRCRAPSAWRCRWPPRSPTPTGRASRTVTSSRTTSWWSARIRSRSPTSASPASSSRKPRRRPSPPPGCDWEHRCTWRPSRSRGRRWMAGPISMHLGVVLYHMVTGRPPFAGGDALAVAVQHLHDAPPSPPVNPAGHSAGMGSVDPQGAGEESSPALPVGNGDGAGNRRPRHGSTPANQHELADQMDFPRRRAPTARAHLGNCRVDARAGRVVAVYAVRACDRPAWDAATLPQCIPCPVRHVR